MLIPVTGRLLEPGEPPGTAATPEERGRRRRVRPPPLSGFQRPITETEKELQRPAAETTGRGNANGHPTVTSCHRAAAGRGGSPSRSRAQRHKHRAARLRGGGGGAHRVPAGPAAPQRAKRSGSELRLTGLIPGRRGRAAAPRCSALRSSLGAAPLTAARRFLPSSAEGRAVTSGEAGPFPGRKRGAGLPSRGRRGRARAARCRGGAHASPGAGGRAEEGTSAGSCSKGAAPGLAAHGVVRAVSRSLRYTEAGNEEEIQSFPASTCLSVKILIFCPFQHPVSPFRHTTAIPVAALYFTSEPGTSHERSGACVHPHSSRNSYCYLKLTSLSLLIYTVLSRGGFGVFFFFLPQLNTDNPVVKQGSLQ